MNISRKALIVHRKELLPYRIKALTLVEVLISTAIIIVLIGITFSLLNSSKQSAKVSEDISKLKQISVAAEIYASQFDDRSAFHLKPILSNGSIPRSIAWSRLDPTPEGWLNYFLEHESKFNPNLKNRKYSERVSFFGLKDIFSIAMSHEEFKLTEGSPGWLVAVSPARTLFINQPHRMLEQDHLRLTFDGSVIHRKSIVRNNQTHYLMLFRDYSEQDVNSTLVDDD